MTTLRSAINSDNDKVYLIAEIGGNHGGNLQYAKDLALLAKKMAPMQ